MADEKAKILTAPDIPNVVKGDGRYLMTMLRDFLAQTAKEVNLANGFSAAEISAADEGKIAAPKNFFLSFDRLGGLLTWDHIYDVSNLAYYEVRTNKNLGNSVGLLERTIDNKSSKLPLTYVGHIFLYAVAKSGDHSTASEISYTKARPTAPTDLALTKDQQGTIITFLAIPLDCIGANIYINNVKNVSVDNIYLYKDSGTINQVRVAYYDQFGEGESTTIYCILPDVQNFMVERNGAQLFFYWDAVPIHGVHYVVKVGTMPDWDKSLTIFETDINKHRYIYPNVGSYYMLIKAVDEHSNYSENAAYVLLDNIKDISKNVIISMNQQSIAYSGNKIGMYYDAAAGELKLDRAALYGEYIIDVQLPQKYRARNWFDYKVIGETNSNLVWDDMDWFWDSDESASTTWNGVIGDLKGVQVTQEIARFTGLEQEGLLEVISLDGGLAGTKGTNADQAKHADLFKPGRWHNGLKVTDLTKLSYPLSIPEEFTLSLNLSPKERMSDCLIATLKGLSGWLVLGYSAIEQLFYLRGVDGITVSAPLVLQERDWITIAISQSAVQRDLFVHSLAYNKTAHGISLAPPVGELSELYCYPVL